MRLVDLPSDVLTMIVKRACRSDRWRRDWFAAVLALTCKTMKTAVDPLRSLVIWRGSALTDVGFQKRKSDFEARKCKLGFCHGITDRALAGLRHVHTVEIHGCDGVTDFSALGGTGTNDEDLCELSTIPTLQLHGNTKVTNLAPLAHGGVRTLAISGSNAHLSRSSRFKVATLRAVHDLTLNAFGCDLCEEELWELRDVPVLTLVGVKTLPSKVKKLRNDHKLTTTLA